MRQDQIDRTAALRKKLQAQQETATGAGVTAPLREMTAAEKAGYTARKAVTSLQGKLTEGKLNFRQERDLPSVYAAEQRPDGGWSSGNKNSFESRAKALRERFQEQAAEEEKNAGGAGKKGTGEKLFGTEPDRKTDRFLEKWQAGEETRKIEREVTERTGGLSLTELDQMIRDQEESVRLAQERLDKSTTMGNPAYGGGVYVGHAPDNRLTESWTNPNQQAKSDAEALQEEKRKLEQLKAYRDNLEDSRTLARDMITIEGMEQETQDALTYYTLFKAMSASQRNMAEKYAPYSYDEAKKLLEEKLGKDFDNLTESYGRAFHQKMMKDVAETGKSQATWAGNAAALGTSFASGFTGTYEIVKQILGIGTTGRYNSYDVNAPGFWTNVYTGAVRQGTQEKIAENTGAWAPVANTAYNAVTSAVDNGLRIAVTGGTGSLALMGLNSFADGVRDATERGGDKTQATIFGLGSAALEVVTEKVSLDNLINTPSPTSLRKALASIAIQGGIEVSEEEASFVGSLMLDALVMAQESEFNQTVQEYQQQGDSRDEALRKAYMGCLEDAAQTAAESFLSGGLMSGGAMEYQKAVNARYESFARRRGQDILRQYPNYAQAAIEEGLKRGKDTEAYRLAEEYSKGKGKLNALEVGLLDLALARDSLNQAAESSGEKTLDQYAKEEPAARMENSQTRGQVQEQTQEQAGRPAAEQEQTPDSIMTAVEQAMAGKSVTNSMAEAIINDPDAVSALKLELDGKTMSEKRAAAKQAVMELAELTQAVKDQAAQEEEEKNSPNTQTVGNLAEETETAEVGNQRTEQGMDQLLTDGETMEQAETAAPETEVRAERETAQTEQEAERETEEPLINVLAPDGPFAYLNRADKGQNTKGKEKAPEGQFTRAAELFPDSVFAEAERARVQALQNTEQGGNQNESQKDAADAGGKRNDGKRAGGKGGTVDESAGGTAKRGTQQIRSAKAAKDLANDLGLRKVSAKELGIGSGSEVRECMVLPESADNGERAKIREIFRQKGVAVQFIVGNMQIVDGNRERKIYGAFLGDRVLIRVDDARRSASRTAAHEMFHVLAAENQELRANAIEKMRTEFSEEALGGIVDRYMQAYEGTDLTEEEILEEMCADCYAGIGDFAKNSGARKGVVEVTEKTRQAEAEAKTRGPPEESKTKFSTLSDSGSPVNMKITNQTESQQFKRWFGDWQKHPETASKVVNEDGTPMEVYHATDADFNIFQREMLGENTDWNATNEFIAATAHLGFWFNTKDLSEEIVTDREKTKQVYLNARNLYDAGSLDDLVNEITEIYDGEDMSPAEMGDAFRDRLENEGYDGVFLNDTEFGGTSYVVFRPEQIKSATENIGTFDGRNQDIRYSMETGTERDQSLDQWYEGQEFGGYQVEPLRTEQEARAAGFPVLDGVQVMPYRTWVRALDRNNYGLVVGVSTNYAGIRMLQVSFLNKETGKRSVVDMPQGNLEVVEGLYQPGKEEMDSLERTAPPDWYEGYREEQVQNAIREAEELERNEMERITGKSMDEKIQKPPEDYDPKKGEEYLKRLPRNVQNYVGKKIKDSEYKVADALGLPKVNGVEFIQDSVRTMAAEYMTNGYLSQATIDDQFETCWEENLVQAEDFVWENEEFYETIGSNTLEVSDEDLKEMEKAGINTKIWIDQMSRFAMINVDGKPVVKESQINMRDKVLSNMAAAGMYGPDQAKLTNIGIEELYDKMNKGYAVVRNSEPEGEMTKAQKAVRILEQATKMGMSQRILEERDSGLEKEYVMWARNDFYAAAAEMVSQLRQAADYQQERELTRQERQQRMDEFRSMTQEDIKEVMRKRMEARKVVERVKRKYLLTFENQQVVDKLIKGYITEEMVPDGPGKKGILETYRAERELRTAAKAADELNRLQRMAQRSEADVLLSSSELKDKKTGISYATETAERNVRDVFKDRDTAEKIISTYFTPVHKSEAESTKFKNRIRGEVKALELSQKVDRKAGNTVSEAAAVQIAGEAMDNIEMLKRQAPGQVREGKTLEEWRAVLTDLWELNPGMNRDKILKSVEKFRQVYDELLTAMNDARTRNGYDPVPYRKGYFPHFQEDTTDSVTKAIAAYLGVQTNVTELPTTINGRTETFKPGIQWFGNAKERLGVNTAYDAVKGFDKYIEGAANVIFQTDNIKRLRALENQLRFRASPDGIKQQAAAVMIDTNMSEEERQSELQRIFGEGKFVGSQFTDWLGEYTNILAGKKSRYDRSFENALGRTRFYNWSRAIERRVAANQVAGNVRSAMTNYIPLTQAWGTTGSKYILQGMLDTTKDGIERMVRWLTKTEQTAPGDSFVDRSTFLTNRIGTESLDGAGTVRGKLNRVAGSLMEEIDRFTAESIVRARYYQNKAKGMTAEQAMDEADSYAASIMADRSRGSMPVIFHANNPVLKLVTQFQLEVNNQIKYIKKDLPREARESGKGIKLIAAALFRMAIGGYIFDEIFEKIFGARINIDPIGTMFEMLEAGTGVEIPNWLDYLDGSDPNFTTERDKTGMSQVGEVLIDAVGQNLPFAPIAGMLLSDVIEGTEDWGRVPVSSAIPNIGKTAGAAIDLFKGISGDPKRAQEKNLEILKKELLKPAYYVLPEFGGGQVKKMIEGIEAYVRGGSYTVNSDGEKELQYAIEDDPFYWIKLAAGGKSASYGARQWVESGFRGLNADQTVAYNALREMGMSNREAFDTVAEIRDVKKTDALSQDAERRKKLEEMDLSGTQKYAVYYSMLADEAEQEKLDELAKLGAKEETVYETLSEIKRVGKEVKGWEGTNEKRDTIRLSDLTDSQKEAMYTLWVNWDESEQKKIDDLKKTGITMDEYLEIKNKWTELSNSKGKMTAGDKTMEMIGWMNDSGFTARQKEQIRESFGFYSQIRGQASTYDNLTGAGVYEDDAYQIAVELGNLKPEDGYQNVRDIQKMETVAAYDLSEEDKVAALKAVVPEATGDKIQKAYDYGVQPEDYVLFRRTVERYDMDGSGRISQKECKAALDSMDLTNQERAVLWQIYTNGKPENNPYSVRIGREVAEE